jgi:hypothetical protein
MIKGLFILLIVLASSTSLAQSESINIDTITIYRYNNSINGMYTQNPNKQINIGFNGENSIVRAYKNFNSNTNYSLGYTTKIINSELLQKTNIGYYDFFVSHIFNHSLARGIKYNNLIGIGYGHKWGGLSLSYASMCENIIYNELPTKNLFRHSVRCKFKYEHDLFSISTEYYYQPNMIKINDVVVYGTTKISLLKKNKLSFTITDIVNYRSLNTVRLMHSINLGITYNLKITQKNLLR